MLKISLLFKPPGNEMVKLNVCIGLLGTPLGFLERPKWKLMLPCDAGYTTAIFIFMCFFPVELGANMELET